MSEEGRAVAGRLEGGAGDQIEAGAWRQSRLCSTSWADIGTSIKSAYKVMGDAGLDTRVVKEIIKRGKRDDRQVALFRHDAAAVREHARAAAQSSISPSPRKEPDEEEGDDDKVVPPQDEGQIEGWPQERKPDDDATASGRSGTQRHRPPAGGYKKPDGPHDREGLPQIPGARRGTPRATIRPRTSMPARVSEADVKRLGRAAQENRSLGNPPSTVILVVGERRCASSHAYDPPN